jgi:hypothetical protein
MARCTPLLFAAVVALVACGKPASESLQTAAKSQPGLAFQTPASKPPQMAAAASAANTPPESARCLDLVNDGAFGEAVPVCVRAARLDPENAAVEQALETARTETASAALGGSSAIPIAREDMAPSALDGKLP